MLTGATAVVILLTIATVAMVAGAWSGWSAMRRARVMSVRTASLAVTGDDLAWGVTSSSRRPVYVRVRMCRGTAATVVAEGWVSPGDTTLDGVAPHRGVHRDVDVTWSSAGAMGLVWWQRKARLTIDPLMVAPRAAGEGAPVVVVDDDGDGDRAIGHLTGRDEIDGIRAWRDGDELTGVHWPSTLRTGEFVLRQRFRERDQRWMVQAHRGTTDPAAEAGRVRHSLERGRGTGAEVAVRVDDDEPVSLHTCDDVLRWCAAFDPHDPAPPAVPWWKRQVGGSPEPDKVLSTRARWTLSLASAVSIVMVLEPLGYEVGTIALVLAAVIAAALVTGSRRRPSDTLRQLLSLLVGVGVGALLIDINAIDSVGASLRYLLPQVLVSLVVMQGFECVDRRGARVTLACAAVLSTYAAGIRVDERLTLWLLVVVALMAAASPAIGRGEVHRTVGSWRHGLRRATALTLAAVSVVAILAVVPVPRGPAQLTLPSWITDRRPTSGGGQLAAPDGSPLLGGASNSRTNGASNASGASGYPGFSSTMDTSLRGDLGDKVVLRVRSPEADFWRGQTFGNFDGRTWYVEDGRAARGERTIGPDHDLKITNGDEAPADSDELIQTFYVQVDMPNIIFAAYRPTRVLLDAPLWQRPDGALRSDVVLPAGSAYTVVSQRNNATPQLLRSFGDLTQYGVTGTYLQLPDTITDRTRLLARQLRQGTASTYDTIIAIEDWLTTNVTYDLDAPVPPDGADAVDDFLFESRRGFCEQIATATAIMLRSLGIPARIATGYVPSSRDEVAGVWISRASDAHAWVEVNFPRLGWVAFDPTANVPLSGLSQRRTIGGDLTKALGELIGAHIGMVLLLGFGLALTLVTVRLVRRWWHRRRRGRWGILQDRFVAAALARGAPPTAANAQLAEVFASDQAAALAAELDASAFSATWTDDDGSYTRARDTLHALTHPT